MKLKQNKQSKVVIALSAVILLLVALSATLTFAYFTANANSNSASVTFGKLSVNLSDQNFYQDKLTEAVTASTIIQPGCTIKVKDDTTINVTTNIKTLLRIKLDVTCAGLSADLYTIANGLSTTDWAKGTGADKYIYYLKDIAANADISLTGVAVKFLEDKIGNTLQDTAVTIKLTVEAIQEEHNLTGEKNATSIAAAFANYTATGIKN